VSYLTGLLTLPLRNRSKEEGASKTGVAQREILSVHSVSTFTRDHNFRNRETMTDTTGGHVDHNLLHEKIRRESKPLRGKIRKNDLEYTYDNWEDGQMYSTSTCTHLSITAADPPDLATFVLARSNPSRPSLSMPVFIGEMRELPDLVRLGGNNLIQHGASGFLAYQFGWKPLLSDLKGMVNFQGLVNKRFQEIARSMDREGLRRRITIDKQSKVSSQSVTLDSATGLILTGEVKKRTFFNKWGTVRWRYSGVQSVLDDGSEQIKMAQRAITGLNLDPANISYSAWNLLPWTWMADWFGNVGDFMQSNMNTVPVTHGNINIMENTATRTEVIVKNSQGFVGGGGEFFRETRKRTPITATPKLAANLPFLSGRQLGILGALAIVRTGGKRTPTSFLPSS
jgi:hypothetical protein